MNINENKNTKKYTSIINKMNNDIKVENVNSKYFEDNNFKRINDEIAFDEDLGKNIMNKNISMDNHDNNNYIFLRTIKTNEINEQKIPNNSSNKINKLLEDNIPDINLEKDLIDNNFLKTERKNEKINIYNNIFISKNDNIINENFKTNKKFEYLKNSTADSFTINSSYENINKLSKYKYAINSFLRQKVKNYIIQISFGRYKTLDLPKNIKDELLKENKNENINNLSNDTDLIKHNFKFTSFDKVYTPIKKSENKKITSSKNIKDEENNFYTRIKMVKQTKKPIRSKEKNKKFNNYEEQISKNIEKNKQNLNNPEEYFSGFFNNILSKKQS